MAKLFFIVSLLSIGSAFAEQKVIYGKDDRLDIVDVTNALHKRLAASTAAMVENKKLLKDSTGRCTLKFNETLETGGGVCAQEDFSQQPIGPICSGFLVGNDTLVTAGHCFKTLAKMGYPTAESVCRGFSWVFNYAIDAHGRDPRVGRSSDVYGCKQIVAAVLTDSHDFTVIKLDRPVTDGAPLKFRETGKIADRTSLVVIGHPSGLPSKVAAGARVLQNNHSTTFVTNLDTFQGNSGSAVFDASTGIVEGILVQGQTDYRPSPDDILCQVVNHCDDNGGNCQQQSALKGEVVTRITELTKYLR